MRRRGHGQRSGYFLLMRTLGVPPPAVVNQSAAGSLLKLIANDSVSGVIPPTPETAFPRKAVKTSKLVTPGVPTLGSSGSPWPSHHLNWILICFPLRCVARTIAATLGEAVHGTFRFCSPGNSERRGQRLFSAARARVLGAACATHHRGSELRIRASASRAMSSSGRSSFGSRAFPCD